MEGYLESIVEKLKRKAYKSMPVRMVYIPKAAGGIRPLGMLTIEGTTVQMAVKAVIEPIFEADFQENSYGFRPKRDAHRAIPLITPAKDAVRRIRADIAAISESTHRKRGRGYKAYPINTSMARWVCTGYLPQLNGLKLRKPLEEDD